MKHTIRGSDVFVKEDLRAIIDALDIAARHQPSGCWREGWLAATAAMRTAIGIDQPEIVTVTERYERIEERHERTVERYAPSPSPAVAPASMPSRRATFAAPVDMTGDDVNVTAFNTAVGRLVEREIGFGWIGNDGSTAFWSKRDWQQISAAEAESWQLLVPEQWIVLARHEYAASQRRQLADNRRLLP